VEKSRPWRRLIDAPTIYFTFLLLVVGIFFRFHVLISAHSIRHIFYAYSLCSRLFSQVLPEVATPHTRPTLHGPRASAGLRAVANIYEQHTKTDNAMSSFQHSSVNILYQVSLQHAAKQLSNRPAGSAHLRMHQQLFSRDMVDHSPFRA